MIRKINHNIYKLFSFLLFYKDAFWQNLSQKREQRRQNCHIPVDFIHHASRLSGVIRNISAIGARIEAPNHLSLGDKIQLSFPLHYLDPCVDITASVVWAEPGSLGIQFDSD